MKNHKQKTKKNDKTDDKFKKKPELTSTQLYALGIAGAAVIILFGKVIVITTALSGLGWGAGKIVKHIEKRRKSKCYV